MLAQSDAAIKRLWTGALWREGPAWNAQGRYLVFSDIPSNRQLRWLEDDGRVTVFRAPSGNSNGNTFDVQAGRSPASTSTAARDVDGNLWASSNAGNHVGYNGVTCWNPAGKLIGRIRLPELCGNIAFGGPKRNRLFVAASQSLYGFHLGTQGAAPG